MNVQPLSMAQRQQIKTQRSSIQRQYKEVESALTDRELRHKAIKSQQASGFSSIVRRPSDYIYLPARDNGFKSDPFVARLEIHLFNTLKKAFSGRSPSQLWSV